ncbi:methyltransferase type 11 [Candidatus Falkowbacteria bacterium RIFOXYB2_FULL_47_14]|uniref:Methyltransferase type 11 n=1 Tax=Candidatus Falkowbacteria bacterium RIFOXYA2_FULL_47_19 TaxID=1797994 RepID=A0A1F5SJ75_9BACT|nr:MAG: methyltransferase type 11 [Candidatus Falkowbacteria bacterium RIFOXYA2_FULL_47_19]OGF35722.1 MAG: methyltransferase type 11 [Candidatus Falkowbacteria bacterium RIFOXYC2_FULL_46_15]OGF43973.1 MAG: methyltransferase type 11 [Candidatus Falkowbacteria bacterium RIFOXYB2_FULL_47_14]
MCNANCVIFGVKNLNDPEVRGKKVIEVGALDLNGSLRPVVQKLNPVEYIGVDIERGPGVDRICRVEDLVKEFGPESFDLVISNELLEHVKDWRTAIANIKNICRPGGIILITTRSGGFPYHAYPHDYWRYEPEDMKKIFADCEIIALERDPEAPGVFVKIRKPDNFVADNLDDIGLYSMVSGRRKKTVEPKDFYRLHYRKAIIKEKLKNILKSLFE